MNQTLIRMLDAINNLLAGMIVIVGLAAGLVISPTPSEKVIYAVIGIMAGLVVASIICGLLALLIEIEKHLRLMSSTAMPRTGSETSVASEEALSPIHTTPNPTKRAWVTGDADEQRPVNYKALRKQHQRGPKVDGGMLRPVSAFTGGL